MEDMKKLDVCAIEFFDATNEMYLTLIVFVIHSITSLLICFLITVERIQEATYNTVMKPILPVIEEFPNDVTSEEGCEILFKVKVKGNSKPSFNWYHNGEPVTDDYAHELRGDGSLLLVSVEEKHKGTYRFVANNDAGTASQQVVLTVAVEEDKRMPSNGTSTGKSGKNLIPVGQFGEFVATGHAKGNEGFKNQFMVRSILIHSLCLFVNRCWTVVRVTTQPQLVLLQAINC